ncbi:hypothetical protein BN6_29080 [Saccharothrix espanaensis DSM 44229]|uniref:Uncharacterized protein n=1 Tax=Saccharothrix espanaensis (strain ATCC 51144 / DSM 44229 / JCM 9112 / NBRC 15066 / NRRL 15764) TaxID=1179773 RepID=K0JY09_SACES|nr:hypothetical protein BN6_29080 [Saccharothrix espanaensis DSM 44229]
MTSSLKLKSRNMPHYLPDRPDNAGSQHRLLIGESCTLTPAPADKSG